MEVTAIHSDIEKTISSFDKPTQVKILRAIEFLKLKEYHIGLPHSRKIKDNLYELRIKGVQSVRVFYTFHLGQIVLLSVFLKKSQKLTLGNIQVAIERKKFLES
ncbi:MAG: type II toxin-antitoxin system RelE/ParE family toxin [bacterium]|nr:type II toxin-antitoxin system RelE/ParE family toxin [bacterium]